MNTWSDRMIRSSVAVAGLFALATAAHAGTVHVANNGVDGPGCGSKEAPCRSITQGIANALAGDTIRVGPGIYGDLNQNGTPGELGEETPVGSCSCVLAVSKPVTVVSSHGAAATVITAELVDAAHNVFIATGGPGGGEFGRPGQGFTVTHTSRTDGIGVLIASTDTSVRGNQVLRVGVPINGEGIVARNDSASVLIERNQVIGWANGISMTGADTTVRGNQVSRNSTGIVVTFGSGVIERNIARSNGFGIRSAGAVPVVGNAVHGNIVGIFVPSSYTGVVEKNNIFGNLGFGLQNQGVVGLPATMNFWGAETGPGADPADSVFDDAGGSTVVTPFATRSFNVRAPIKL